MLKQSVTEMKKKIMNQVRKHERNLKRGLSLIEILVGVVVSVAILIGITIAVSSRKSETDLNRALALISADIPSALSSYYLSMNGSYTGLTSGSTDATTSNGATSLVNRFGLDKTISGSAWSIATAGAQQLTFTFPCTNLRNAEACSMLANAVTAQQNPMITTVTPTVTACTATGTGGAVANCKVDVVMVRPR